MSALAPLGGLPLCEVEAVRRYAQTVGGTATFVGALTPLKLAVLVTLTATLAIAAVVTAPLVAKVLTASLAIFTILGRALLRRPLRFAARKGVIVKGTWH